jgi:dynein heavy chain
VANKFIKNIELPDDKIRNGLTEMCMNVSIDVTELCDKYAKELRRKVYTTPKSYLDHIMLYELLLAEKRDEIEKINRKLSFGLEKLYATNETVIKLQGEMTILKPQLA